MWSDWSGLEKLIWLHVLKGASKIIRTITGAAPLNLEKAVKAAIVKLTQYGKVTTVDGDTYCNNGKLVAVHRSGLPSGYKLLEYVGGNGSRYVLTDVYLASTDVVECEFKNSTTTGYGAMYGVFKLGESSALYANQNYYGYDADNNKVDTGIRVDTEWHFSRHDFVHGTLTIDDTTVSFEPFEFVNTTKNAVLSRYYNGSYGYNWKGFIRKFKVTRNGEVVCDLLPAKNSNDVAGLYDLVTGNFYTGTGGALLEGNEVDDYELRIVGTPEVLTIGEETTSGAIASFTTSKASPLHSLSVAVEPIQDLHGYDNPWPAGGGKNLLNLIDGTYTYSTGITVQISNGEMKVTGTASTSGGRTQRLTDPFVLKAGTYIMSPAPGRPYIRGYLNRASDDSVVGVYSGTAFTTTEDETVYYGINIEADKTYDATIKPQLEAGSTITSWTPYSNICPISGHDSVTVTRTGKNLNPYEGVNYTTDTHPNGIFLKAGTYIFSLDTGVAFGYNHAMYIKLKDENGNVITNGNISGDGWQLNGSGTHYYGGGDANMPKPFNLLKDCYVCFGFNNQYPTDGNNVQLELGSTATAYEPYQGNTYSITFPSSAGTVYGGTLDVTTGKLTVDRAMVDLGTLTWASSHLAGITRFRGSVSGIKQVSAGNQEGNMLCSHYETKTANQTYIGETGISSQQNADDVYIYDPQKETLTATEFKAAMSGVQLCYELATPIVYDLTPTEVSTLLGTNNVWSDTGDVTVTYAPNGVVQTASVVNLFAAGDVKDEQDIISGVVTRRTVVSVSGGEVTISALAEPVTERVTAQPLRTAKGNNTVSVTSNVDPVYLECEYAASEE